MMRRERNIPSDIGSKKKNRDEDDKTRNMSGDIGGKKKSRNENSEKERCVHVYAKIFFAKRNTS